MQKMFDEHGYDCCLRKVCLTWLVDKPGPSSLSCFWSTGLASCTSDFSQIGKLVCPTSGDRWTVDLIPIFGLQFCSLKDNVGD